MRLIDVEEDLIRALDRLIECDEAGEDVPDDALQIVKERTLIASEKRESVALFLSFVEGREAEVKLREDALAKQRKAITRARERLEEYILAVMRGAGIETACAATVKFTVGRSEAVEVDNPDALPDALVRLKREADKKAVKAALEGGQQIDAAAGARLVSRESLRVKPLATKDRPGDTLLRKDALQ